MKLATVISIQDSKFAALPFRGDLADNLEKIAQLGYSGVELAVRNPQQVDKEKLKELITRNALTACALGTGQAFVEDGLSFTSSENHIRKQALERLKSHIRLGSYLHCPIIIGLIRGKTEQDKVKSESLKLLQEYLCISSEYASSFGVELLLEPINRYETDLINNVDEAIEIIQKISSPNTAILADTFHMNIEEPSIVESIRKAGKLLKHIHFADSNRWAPGFGHIDFKGILQVLKEINFNHYISFEIMPKPHPEQAVKQAIDYIKTLISTGS